MAFRAPGRLARAGPARRARGPRGRRRALRAAAGAGEVGGGGGALGLTVVGGVCVDLLATVPRFPALDSKTRTKALERQHGGNAGNAAVAAARLSPLCAGGVGLSTVVAGDAAGDEILASFAAEGVLTDGLVRVDRTPGAVSPFTYIIIDEETDTRTCIHTPGLAADLLSEDGAGRRVDLRAISRSGVVFFDGRHTGAAASIAARCAAAEPRPCVVVEAESVRAGLEGLMAHADGLMTSSHFPGDFTRAATLGGALRALLSRFPALRWIVTTMGSAGSLMIERVPAAAAAEGGARSIDDAIEALRSAAARGPPAGDALGARTGAGDWVGAGPVATSAAFRPPDEGEGADAYVCRFAAAAALPPELVVDSTGAGDAYNGAFCSALARGGLPWSASMTLASVVAAVNCTSVGARGGLPRLDQLSEPLRALLLGGGAR